MTFDEWFVKYPLPAEIDTMDDTDREQWTWALRSAYKTGAAAEREACAKVCDDKVEAEYATGKVDHNEMAWTQFCAMAIRLREKE